MDLQSLIDQYRVWITANPKTYKIDYGYPVVSVLVPILDSLPEIAESVLSIEGIDLFTLKKIDNKESLDGLSAWYKYVYTES